MAIVPTLPPLIEGQRTVAIEYLRQPSTMDSLGVPGLVVLCAALVLLFLLVFVFLSRLDARVRLLQDIQAQKEGDELMHALQEDEEELELLSQGVATRVMGGRVSEHLHANWYQHQLSAIQDAMAERGYRFVQADDEGKGVSVEFLPHDALEYVARKLMIARSAYTHPRDPDAEHERHADSALAGGYGQMLVKEIIDCLIEQGFSIEFFAQDQGAVECSTSGEAQQLDSERV